jgi:hypothetical protein
MVAERAGSDVAVDRRSKDVAAARTNKNAASPRGSGVLFDRDT